MAYLLHLHSLFPEEFLLKVKHDGNLRFRYGKVLNLATLTNVLVLLLSEECHLSQLLPKYEHFKLKA